MTEISKKLRDLTERVDQSGGLTLAQVKADSDIASTISSKHSNTLDHSNSQDHSNANDHNGGTQDSAIAGKEPANANIQAHVTAAHAPSNAQKNSDITKAEIEAKLTGELTSHTHAGGSGESETVVVITGAVDNSTVNLTNATGLTFAALANSTYVVEVFLVWAASAATVGIKVSATASGSPTVQAGRFASDAVNGTPDSSSWNTNDIVVTTSASPFTTNNLGMVHALLKTSVSTSTWQLRFAAETTGTITLQIGSTLRYRKVA